MIKSRTVILILILLLGISFSEAQVLPKDSLCNEFRYFVKLLEETHPDPYTEFGGKIEFRKKAFNLEQQLKSGEYTLEEYSSLLSGFVANLHDGHTSIFSNNSGSKDVKYIPLGLKTIPEGIIIVKLPAEHKKYLGARILEMNGLSIDSICNKLSEIKPSENKYNSYGIIQSLSNNPGLAAFLFPDMESRISLTVLTVDEKKENFSLQLTPSSIWNLKDIAQVPVWNDMPINEYLYYKSFDKNTVYLRMKSIMSRENFLYMRQQNWPSMEGQLKSFYQYTLRKEMPEDTDEAIAAIPCFAEIFHDMLLEMRKNNAQNLIIDLRGNSGGWTPITLPTLYMLFGDEYLNKDMDVHFYRLFSPLYMKKTGTTLEDFNKNNDSDYRYGDYSFANSIDENFTQEEKQKNFVNNAMGNSADYIKDLAGQALYTPENIYVITDIWTFSAAFHYTFYLWKMGAVVVGVPPSQAPNTYMEMTEFELPYTKLKGSISNSAQYFLPVKDKRSKIFWPDRMPEYEDYKKYNFDQDTEVIWLLDYIKNNQK